MRRTTNRIMGTLAALLLGATLATAQAPDTNNMTIVTFSAPVSLPGVTLPAGSYLFKLADSQVNRNIVQVFDKDRSKILATILAIPAERLQPADETVITFGESPANTAPAIRFWYYPGDKRGQEFAYPKKQAQEIANAAHESVLAIDTEDNSAEAMTKGDVSRVEPAEPNQPAQSAQPSTPQSTPSPSTEPQSAQAAPQPAQPEATRPQATQPEPATPSTQPRTTEQPSATPSAQATTPSTTQGAVGTAGRSELPKTASTLPLVGFAGLLALVSAFGVRALRRAHV
ncbi:MAG TPA: hypothetical protein VFT39_21470 [Vicinamibacterales bacterium]|nr:hypothetical protein [Vicinamibacterales bacterium]